MAQWVLLTLLCFAAAVPPLCQADTFYFLEWIPNTPAPINNYNLAYVDIYSNATCVDTDTPAPCTRVEGAQVTITVASGPGQVFDSNPDASLPEKKPLPPSNKEGPWQPQRPSTTSPATPHPSGPRHAVTMQPGRTSSCEAGANCSVTVATDQYGSLIFYLRSSEAGQSNLSVTATLDDGTPISFGAIYAPQSDPSNPFAIEFYDHRVSLAPSFLEVAVDSRVLVKATYSPIPEQSRHTTSPSAAAASAPTHGPATDTVTAASVEGVNITFYRWDNEDIRQRPTGKHQDLGRSDSVFASALTDKDGTASLWIDGFLSSSTQRVTDVFATYRTPSGAEVGSNDASMIIFQPRPIGVEKPTLTPSSSKVAPGEPITVTLTALTWDGAIVPNASTTFVVDGPASLQLTPPRLSHSRAPLGKLPSPKRGAAGDVTTQTNTAGQASITLSSSEAAAASVSAFYWVREEQVTLPGISLSWEETSTVTAISLTPDTQIVPAGRYAQLSAVLTPALPGVKVSFTATAITPLGDELRRAGGATHSSFEEEPVGTPQQTAPLAAAASDSDDNNDDNTAEVADFKLLGSGRHPTQRVSALSNAQGVAAASLWSPHPCAYRVKASVINNSGPKVSSNRVVVRWAPLSDIGDYYRQHPEEYRGAGRVGQPHYKQHPRRQYDSYYHDGHHTTNPDSPGDHYGSGGVKQPSYPDRSYGTYYPDGHPRLPYDSESDYHDGDHTTNPNSPGDHYRGGRVEQQPSYGQHPRRSYDSPDYPDGHRSGRVEQPSYEQHLGHGPYDSYDHGDYPGRPSDSSYYYHDGDHTAGPHGPSSYRRSPDTASDAYGDDRRADGPSYYLRRSTGAYDNDNRRAPSYLPRRPDALHDVIDSRRQEEYPRPRYMPEAELRY